MFSFRTHHTRDFRIIGGGVQDIAEELASSLMVAGLSGRQAVVTAIAHRYPRTIVRAVDVRIWYVSRINAVRQTVALRNASRWRAVLRRRRILWLRRILVSRLSGRG